MICFLSDGPQKGSTYDWFSSRKHEIVQLYIRFLSYSVYRIDHRFLYPNLIYGNRMIQDLASCKAAVFDVFSKNAEVNVCVF